MRGEECEGDSFEVAVEFGVEIDFTESHMYIMSLTYLDGPILSNPFG